MLRRFLTSQPWLLIQRASSLQFSTRLMGTAADGMQPRFTLEEQLRQAPWLHLLKVPDAGRGMFAATDIEQGTVVWEEAPMLCTPSPHSLAASCHACLRPLPPDSTGGTVASGTAERSSSGEGQSSNSRRFCSQHCQSSAQSSWASAAAACDFGGLQRVCQEAGEKFPLMAAQLACMQVQQWQAEQDRQQQHGPQEHGASEAPAPAASHAAPQGAAAHGPSCGAPLTQLGYLCFANISDEPPAPWVHLHGLLLAGLAPLASRGGSWPACSERRLREELSLGWFCRVLARLHLNAFRVDTVPPLDHSDPGALLRAAAASLGGSVGLAQPDTSSGGSSSSGSGSDEAAARQAQPHQAGSAAFLLASMLNHSCEPNLDVCWPQNNAVVALTAARDIAAGEQLTISYIDAEQGPAQRRAALQFAYGFTCRCPRCQEGS